MKIRVSLLIIFLGFSGYLGAKDFEDEYTSLIGSREQLIEYINILDWSSASSYLIVPEDPKRQEIILKALMNQYSMGKKNGVYRLSETVREVDIIEYKKVKIAILSSIVEFQHPLVKNGVKEMETTYAILKESEGWKFFPFTCANLNSVKSYVDDL